MSDQFPAIEADLYCLGCGYNLRGLTGMRCPECGGEITSVRQQESQIPWVHRESVGRLRAYWKTVWMVVRHRRQLCIEVNRPVDEAAARRFRWITVWLGYLPLLLVTLALFAFDVLTPTAERWIEAAVVNLAVLICLATVTALPFYALYHRDVPPVRRQRAAVLTLYCSAPLVFGGAIALLEAAGHLAKPAAGNWEFASPLIGLLASFVLICHWWARTAAVIRELLQDRRLARRINLKLGLLSLATALLALVGIPLTALFLALVYLSL